MRIGLFTDTYFPNTNGITYVVDILRKNMEELGHEVYIFAPEPRARHWFRRREKHVVRIPAIEGLFFEEQQTSLFFPYRQVRKVGELELDAIVTFTPGQIGLLGVYSAIEHGTLHVEQYSTDLVAYIKRYPLTLPVVMALLLATPVVLKVSTRRMLRATRVAISQTSDSFSQETARQALTLLHERCDAIIAVSEKSAKEIASYSGGSPILVIPTGVDALPFSKKEVTLWRKRWRAGAGTTVFLYAGRLSKEKNVELLISSFGKVAETNHDVRLVIVGSFSHEDSLKRLASQSDCQDRIYFTGRIPRERLGSVYVAADAFCFPSLTDTQALVINEAAHASLPIIWCDPLVNEVALYKKSGLLTLPNVGSFSAAMSKLAIDPKLRRRLGRQANSRAGKMTELHQTKKLLHNLKRLV